MGEYQLQTNNCRNYVKKAYEVIQTFRFDVYWETLGRLWDLTYTMDDIMKLGQDSFDAGEVTVGGIRSTEQSKLLKKAIKHKAKKVWDQQ